MRRLGIVAFGGFVLLFVLLGYNGRGGLFNFEGKDLKAINHKKSMKADALKLVDSDADHTTRALYRFLYDLPEDKILMGQEDALAYGVQWKNESDRSDMQDVCGSHPAVFGWDVGKLGQYPHNIDTVDFEQMKKWIIQVHEMGGMNTISWHMDNPVSGGDPWDKTKAVHTILPGGVNHQWYRSKLDTFAVFVHDLVSFQKGKVPILFRPFHEHTGSWFWWGEKHCSEEAYKELWRFTVTYLRDEKGIHQLLYVYSPDRVFSEADYLKRYPGDDYVDVLGIDNYWNVWFWTNRRKLTRCLRMLVRLAEKKGKVAALTETGQNRIPNRKWWTQVLLKRVAKDPVARRIAYMMVWRNANEKHHFAPYAGHRSADDFRQFVADPQVLMLEDLKREKLDAGR